ncbi:MAG: hypothetical protein AB8G16_01325 [Gammaproteobacteria bacterium]
MIETLLQPATLIIIGALMALETLVLTRVFAKRKDRRNVGITLGNATAGVCLMAAIASEMADQATWLTGAFLIGALIAHMTEVWLRLR